MARAEHSVTPPRIVVAGLAGDTGKSLVTLGLIRALRARGERVAGFKKGPDFIDAAWLGAAAGTPGRKLMVLVATAGALTSWSWARVASTASKFF